MNQGIFTRLLWWGCDKIDHPFARGWVYNGHYHRDCKICGRIISVPLRGDK